MRECIRELDNAQFVVINQASAYAYQRFQAWWYNEHDNNIASYFWDDLDFTGMAIIKSMRRKFTNLRAWREAYEVSVRHHNMAAKHEYSGAKKNHQGDPALSGCDYADQELLLSVRSPQAFTDQEVVCESEIVQAIEAPLRCDGTLASAKKRRSTKRYS